jgi:carbamoyltransferase
MNVLGINMLHGDSSACLVKNGKLISAVEEERFTRIKHCSEFPIKAITYCLNASNIQIDEIDYVTINTNYKYNFLNRIFFLLKNIFKINFISNRAESILGKVKIKNKLESINNKKLRAKFIFVPHHLSHAYSTMFFTKENKNSLIFSFDGSGDFSTIETYKITNNKIKLIQKNIFPHSLGLFYSAFTQFLGFNKFGDEYKFMGLAGYGKPIYYDEIKKIVKNFVPFQLDMDYLNLPKIDYSNRFPQSNKLFNEKFEEYFRSRFNQIPNNYEIQFSKDIASSVQKVFEEVVIANLNHLTKGDRIDNLYLTGGCAFNSSLVGKIIKTKKFDRVLVDTNPGDAGGAVGSAFCFLHQKRQKIENLQQTKYLGPIFSNEEIKNTIIEKIKNNKKFKFKYYENIDELYAKSAELIFYKNIIFWFQDSLEWGPRALGNRSILANPVAKNIKNFINKKIKKRESFRPFAPAVLEEEANLYFEMMGHKSPNMNIVFDAKIETIKNLPEIIHADNTCRVQTVSIEDNKKFYKLIEYFKKISGHPILINTSMNVDAPIVNSPLEAFETFLKTDVEDLVLNNWLIQKNSN